MEDSAQQPASEDQTPPAASSENVRVAENGIMIVRVTGKPIAIMQTGGTTKLDNNSTSL